jgi:similar to stage IV sporulation protein
VAACSGEIVRFEVMAGQIRVKRGQKVKEGDLLISGITEGQNGSFSVSEAKGRVFAKTWHRFEVRIPLESEETVFTGREEKGVSYEILGLRVASPHYEESDFERAKCIETEERLTVLGRSLPILLKERVWCEIGEKKERITVDRAKKKAYDKYEEYKRETFAIDTEFLEERAEWICDEESVTLRLEVDAVEDIFSSKPFSITEFSKQ